MLCLAINVMVAINFFLVETHFHCCNFSISFIINVKICTIAIVSYASIMEKESERIKYTLLLLLLLSLPSIFATAIMIIRSWWNMPLNYMASHKQNVSNTYPIQPIYNLDVQCNLGARLINWDNVIMMILSMLIPFHIVLISSWFNHRLIKVFVYCLLISLTLYIIVQIVRHGATKGIIIFWAWEETYSKVQKYFLSWQSEV